MCCQKNRWDAVPFFPFWYIQLFQERLSEKVHSTVRKVLWVVLSSLFFKEIWENGTRGHGRMFASARGKQQTLIRQATVSGTVYWSYPIIPFGIVACTFFSDNLSQNSCIYIYIYIFFLSKYARQFWTSCKYIWSSPRPLKCILTLNYFKGVTFAIAVADPGGAPTTPYF